MYVVKFSNFLSNYLNRTATAFKPVKPQLTKGTFSVEGCLIESTN